MKKNLLLLNFADFEYMNEIPCKGDIGKENDVKFEQESVS